MAHGLVLSASSVSLAQEACQCFDPVLREHNVSKRRAIEGLGVRFASFPLSRGTLRSGTSLPLQADCGSGVVIGRGLPPPTSTTGLPWATCPLLHGTCGHRSRTPTACLEWKERIGRALRRGVQGLLNSRHERGERGHNLNATYRSTALGVKLSRMIGHDAMD